jgi:PqqD family protein of HPr-rel-A system
MWDQEAVVYVHATGATHALSPSASAVLATLLEHPGECLSCEAWLAALSAGDADEDLGPSDTEDLKSLHVVLDELESIGLAVRRST